MIIVTFSNGGTGQLNEDGTFVVNNVFGPARFQVSLPDGWAVTAILHEGQDITDAPIAPKTGEQLTGVQVMVTNHITAVTGQFVDDKGVPSAEGTLIVFPADSTKWFDNSRFIKVARPDQQGRCQMKGLPPGEYLAVGVDYVEDGLWYDPEYLDSLRRNTQQLTLMEGQVQAISVKFVTSQQR
jgi:hypothetical protein